MLIRGSMWVPSFFSQRRVGRPLQKDMQFHSAVRSLVKDDLRSIIVFLPRHPSTSSGGCAEAVGRFDHIGRFGTVFVGAGFKPALAKHGHP